MANPAQLRVLQNTISILFSVLSCPQEPDSVFCEELMVTDAVPEHLRRHRQISSGQFTSPLISGISPRPEMASNRGGSVRLAGAENCRKDGERPFAASVRRTFRFIIADLGSFGTTVQWSARNRRGYRSSCLGISFAQPDQLAADTAHLMSAWGQFRRSRPELSVTHTVVGLEPVV